MKTGLVLGKFYPPHAGHLFLIRKAKQQVDFLTVVVGSLPTETIDPNLRVSWLRQLVPINTAVILIPDDNPPGVTASNPVYFKIWAKNLKNNLPYVPEYLFGSEEYIDPLALAMGMFPVMIDSKRKNVPISATQIRQDPHKYWDFIPPIVQSYFEGGDKR